MTDVFDVIVVGAGPGGSNAAAAALKRGLSVAQIDRSTFPRVKPCAGALTIKSCSALQLDVLPMLRSEYRAVEFSSWPKRTSRFAARTSPVLRMVFRPEFDNWLVTQNLKRDRFRFFTGERVREIAYSDVFHVVTTTQTLRGRHLVGADGAYSLVNKTFNVTRPKGYAVAVEVIVRRDEATLRQETPPCFDFGAIDRGYGWIFPKDDHWSVGLYTLSRRKDLRERLGAYISAKGFRLTGDPLETFEAHLFPYGGYRVAVPDAPVYIVGDAGGFGDAITGEGIYHALESGRIAGETIADCVASRVKHTEYYRRLRSVLADTFMTYHVSKEFYRDVDKALTILENPLVWRPCTQGYAEGATFSASIKKSGWFLAKSLALRSLEHQRRGASLPFSLRGPFRGLTFFAKGLVRRALTPAALRTRRDYAGNRAS